MSQINTNAEGLYNLAKTLETLTNGHITVSEIFFLDELWFGNGDNYAWAAYFALPQQYQYLMSDQIQWARQAQNFGPTNTPAVDPSMDPSMGNKVPTVGMPQTSFSDASL
jgi:hypothetical protein